MKKYLFAFLMAFTANAGATVIDFEDLPIAFGDSWHPADDYVITSGGFDFVNGPTSFIPDLHVYNNTAGLSLGDSIEMASHGDLIMTQNGGGTFSLNSFALGSNWVEEATFTVIGTLFGGGTVSQIFSLDGDNTTYELFSLNSSFTNLTAVNWLMAGGTQQLFNIDNITVNAAVPEPATIALLGLGLVGLGFTRKLKKS